MINGPGSASGKRLLPLWFAALFSTWLLAPAALLAQTPSLAPTTQTSIGLFYQPDAPRRVSLREPGDIGEALNLRGRVVDPTGMAVANALVELWHADAIGSVDESRYRTAQVTNAKGVFGIKTILPGHIEMARDNYVFAGRHIHIMVSHPAFGRLVSLIFFKGDERLSGNPYPELAIPLEQARTDEGEVLFGRVQIVLEPG
ncbi:MAG: hypothetical protein AAF458_14440 [Pseudomonadota bacterium]